ncbi:MAG: DnaJ domain-containing protein [Deltaproteobacteria bacterium]|jgi:curved DNA-binding protein CbpA|nr:DnaJ domain-containing protein [Deltaproteobacteria bacterium]
MEAVNQNLLGHILALTPDRDATQLSLTTAEGYLLSRIDGATPWRLLREIGGIPTDEVDACLSRWLEEGVLQVVGGPASSTSDASAADPPPRDQSDAASAVAEPQAETAPLLEIDESALDEALELEIEIQRRILEYEAGLGRPYHELLGVERGAEPRVVKRAYFRLSKEFHPDRYFRRAIGDYALRLDRIFKKVLEAYELLSDPDLCRVENQPVEAESDPDSEASAGAEASVDAASAVAASGPPPQPRAVTKLERLRQRMPFKIDHAAIAARRAKADEIFKASELSQRNGRLQEAEANIRIAISFDPSRAEFKEALGSLRIQMAGARATKLLASPSDHMSDSELREALQLLEDVLIYRPHDPELNDRAARVCLRLGKLDPAQEYAETCIERCPDVAAYHTLLGRIYREKGNLDAAMHEFETALKHDAEDLDAQRALASVRIGHRDAVRGGAA